MRHHVLLALSLLCALPLSIAHAQSTTLQNEQANDTPACTAVGAPAYCYLPASDEPPLSTASANQNPDLNPPIQTVTVDAVGHLENAPYLPIGKLMPNVGSNAWAGKVICEYQPWFSVNSQASFGGNVGDYNGHIDIGYDEGGLGLAGIS